MSHNRLFCYRALISRTKRKYHHWRWWRFCLMDRDNARSIPTAKSLSSLTQSFQNHAPWSPVSLIRSRRGTRMGSVYDLDMNEHVNNSKLLDCFEVWWSVTSLTQHVPKSSSKGKCLKKCWCRPYFNMNKRAWKTQHQISQMDISMPKLKLSGKK